MAEQQSSHQPSRETIAYNRVETRFVINGFNSEKVSDHFTETVFPDPYTTTVYFGKPGNETDRFFERGQIRVRFRSKQPPTGENFAIDPDQICKLEIKTHLGYDPNPGVKHKYMIDGLTFRQIMSIFKDRKALEGLKDYPQGDKVIRVLEALMGTYEGPLVPVAACEYKRRHFTERDNPKSRITVDENVTFSLLTEYKEMYLGIRMESLGEQSIIEVKQPEHASQTPLQLMEDFYKDTDAITPLGPLQAKFSHIQSLVAKGRYPWVLYPEQIDVIGSGRLGVEETIGREFIKLERERKIDLSGDPRDVLRDLATTPWEREAILTPPRNNIRNHQFFITGDPNRTVATWTDHNGDRFYKGKLTVPDGSKELVRHEVISGDLESVLRQIDLPVREYPWTPPIHNHRLFRRVIFLDTGNVYAVAADHVTADDGRDPLNQIEIEYQGKIGFNDQEKHSLTEQEVQEIDSDIDRIQAHLTEALGHRGIQILPTKTSKSEWIQASTSRR